MEILATVLKYGFAVILLAEVGLILRALWQIAVEKARPAQAQPPATEE